MADVVFSIIGLLAVIIPIIGLLSWIKDSLEFADSVFDGKLSF